MSEISPLPSDALRKQLATDAGPHATPDQERAAEKRRAAAGGGVSDAPERAEPAPMRTAAKPKRSRKA